MNKRHKHLPTMELHWCSWDFG